MTTKKVDVDALRERAFRMAQSGLQSARELASAIEQLHDYDGPAGWSRPLFRPACGTVEQVMQIWENVWHGKQRRRKHGR